MAPKKPHAHEPGHYRSKETPHGWFVVIDYPLRLAKSGSVLQVDAPWCVWHPASDTVIGFTKRKDATDALDSLAAGVDVQGMLATVGDGQMIKFAGSESEEKDGSPAQARATDDFAASFMRAMQERFPSPLLFDRLEDAMTASTVASCEGVKYWRPDWGARIKALELSVAYLIGRPIERQQIITSNAPASWDDIMKLASKSQVFRETLLSMLKEMEKSPVREAETA